SLEEKHKGLVIKRNEARDRINDYKREVSRELKTLENERNYFSRIVRFFGHDTHKDDREEIVKSYSDKMNVEEEKRNYDKLSSEIGKVIANLNKKRDSLEQNEI